MLPSKPTLPEQMPAGALLLAPITLAYLVWRIAVTAHIVRHSLDISMWAGVAMVLLWTLIAMIIVGLGGAPGLT
jgi:hypothetical protein